MCFFRVNREVWEGIDLAIWGVARVTAWLDSLGLWRCFVGMYSLASDSLGIVSSSMPKYLISYTPLK